MKKLGLLIFVVLIFTLQTCKHPLVIVGKGDIVDINNSGHGCTLEEFQAQDPACTDNEVTGDYFVNYKAEPRPGWRYVRWEGPCAPSSDFQHCYLHVPESVVSKWDEEYPDRDVPPVTAVFERITGETGYLAAGAAVAGVSYETPTQRGVTGIDGSFHYEGGEPVRFTIGSTLLGEVIGQETVTVFELAGSEVLTGIEIDWSLENEPWATGPGEGSPYPNEFFTDTLQETNPFHTVANLSVLLQSLDHDANPANGIEIRQGVTKLFKHVNLDLVQEWQSFLTEPSLLHAIWRANKVKAFSEAHGPVTPATAMHRLYSSTNIGARTVGMTTEREKVDPLAEDRGAPGQSALYEYDSEGNRTRESYSGEQGLERIVAREYNDWGNVSQELSDGDADGIPDKIVSHHFDPPGYLWRQQWDHNGDGITDYSESWTYDQAGNATLTREGWVGDIDGDPVDASSVTRYSYSHGNLARIDYVAEDGTVDRYDTYEYDERGLLRRVEKNVQDNGVPGFVKTFEYDSNDNLIRSSSDQLAGDEPPLVLSWQYDSRGNITEHHVDEDGDGIPNFLEKYTYDELNNLTLAEIFEDENDDGTLDGRVFSDYMYDLAGRLISRTSGSGERTSPSVEELRKYEYDSDNRLSRVLQDGNGDGTFDVIQVYEYDQADNLINSMEYTPPFVQDENRLSGEYWQYSVENYLMRYELYDDADNTPELVRQYDSTGWGHFFMVPDSIIGFPGGP
ncbi:MAG: hypothetical protein GWP63_05645 [Haliea sp.]|jgi:YD repeat-containing protein|nr:hypothetical protein [Haliea sp.]